MQLTKIDSCVEIAQLTQERIKKGQCNCNYYAELELTGFFWQLQVVCLMCLLSSCFLNNMLPFLFQNGLVSSSPEMFKLKSCIRRKTDSIDKRFCFDIEVVERFDFSFHLICLNVLSHHCFFLCLDINMKQHKSVFQSFKE